MQKYYLEHLSDFGELSSTTKEGFCDRLISLCWCGHWRADAVSYLQRITEYTIKNLPLMLSRLEDDFTG